MKVLFLGTPEFARPSLEALHGAGHAVTVVTRPDRPQGRGQKPAPSPVKELALSLGLPLLQPDSVNAEASLQEFRALGPEIVVVVAFGAILKRPLLTLAPRGAVNVHASLLPAYRGVAPVPWCLIHGARTTGVTTMLLDEGVDTGPMLGRRIVDVNPLETAGELLSRLSRLGGELLTETLAGLEAGTTKPVRQPDEGTSYAPKLTREHGYLDLSRPAPEVFDQFRGVTPHPGARVFLGEDAVLVSAMRPVAEGGGAPYDVLEIGRRHLRVAAGKGAVDLLTVRPPGKPDMEGSAMAHGRHLAPGHRLTPPPALPDLAPRVAVTK